MIPLSRCGIASFTIMTKKHLLVGLMAVLSSPLAGQESLTLEDCVERAIAYNYSVQQTANNALASASEKQAAFGSFFPSVNASGGYFNNSGLVIDPVTNEVSRSGLGSGSGTLSSNVTLFDGMQTWHQWKRSQIEHVMSLYQLQSAKNDVALNTAAAFLQYMLSEEALLVAQEQVQLSHSLQTRVSALHTVGSVAMSEMYQTKTQVARDEQRVVSAKNQWDLSRLILLQHMGMPADAGVVFHRPALEVTEKSTVLMTIPSQRIYEASVNHQPSIEVARLSVQSAYHAKKATLGTFYPQLSLSGQVSTSYSNKVYNYTTTTQTIPIGYFINPLNQSHIPVFTEIAMPSNPVAKPFADQVEDNVRQFVGLSMSVPLFNGFQSRSQVRRATLNQRNAELQWAQQKDNYRQTIERAYADASAALSQFRAAEITAEASKENFRFAKIRREEGQMNAYDYSSAQNSYLSAMSDVLRSKYDCLFKMRVLELYMNNTLTLAK